MRQVIDDQRLCFAATICHDGAPNLSPKGTIWAWSDTQLAFFELASPQTVANLRRDPRIELNIVDQRLRKGFRFRGRATVTSDPGAILAALERFPRTAPARSRIRSVVVIDLDEARPLVSPVYAITTDEDKVAREWENYWLGLWGRS